ncbi:MAG TPA: hypothetical protein PLD40_07575 [Kiritimatiellia bacterium]|jgi:hypothetical protein|nr:hypothetical protein [Kiritimatiellia bacterium]OQC57059.1 MAG: hypothetical protein BWX54_01266 [Verrucomicrobia bacterium ADurb.Bin018]MBP9572886.1 hypothetical protein [Kiritimatiellia bacterium]HOE00638.1 hypothetical protein [Kiritimatiellia bacterium]HOE37167.1 hypothetical protein [Kiritimatiellia bacterium]
MNRLPPLLIALALSGAAAFAQQRIEFQRQKFDRSRFERPGTPGAPAEPALPPAEPVGTTPSSASTPMLTVPPESSSIFSYSNEPSTGGSTWSSGASTNTGGGSIFSADAPALSGPPPYAYPANSTPEERAAIDSPHFDQVPSKWFTGADRYPQLLALQKETGACILVYFKRVSEASEKGLCSWFEKGFYPDIAWRKAMRYFIKLEIQLPGGSATRELAEQFKVNKTPAIFVVKPGSTFHQRLMVFDYPKGSRPEPIPVPTVLNNLKERATPAYQNLF